MLVCSVVLRPQRHTVAATIVEIAGAFDDPSIGAIFATLTDDNGNALDTVDAFSGKVMLEAANAAATVDAGSIRNAAIVEETNAGASPNASVLDASGGISVTMGETTAADSAQDATITGAFATTMLDGAFVTAAATSTLLGTEIIDSGPIAPFD